MMASSPVLQYGIKQGEHQSVSKGIGIGKKGSDLWSASGHQKATLATVNSSSKPFCAGTKTEFPQFKTSINPNGLPVPFCFLTRILNFHFALQGPQSTLKHLWKWLKHFMEASCHTYKHGRSEINPTESERVFMNEPSLSLPISGGLLEDIQRGILLVLYFDQKCSKRLFIKRSVASLL